jgi:N-methylhydantoinase A
VRYLIATDTGGTFTDVAVYDREAQKVTYGKTLTNYGDLIDGVLDGLSTIDARHQTFIANRSNDKRDAQLSL